MKRCAVCGHVAPDFAKSCRCCGEATWRKVADAPLEVAEPIELDDVEPADEAAPEPAATGSSHASRGRRGRRR